MSIKSLISGQTIKIDNHIRGCNVKFEWNEAIHLHKRMNGRNRFKNAEVIIPLSNKGKLIFKKVHGKEKIVAERIKNEIRHAFEDTFTRNNFVNSFYEELVDKLRSCDINDIKEQKKIIRQALDIIVDFFGVKSKYKENIHTLIDDDIHCYTIDNNNTLYAKVNVNILKDEYSITLGDKQDEISYGVSTLESL